MIFLLQYKSVGDVDIMTCIETKPKFSLYKKSVCHTSVLLTKKSKKSSFHVYVAYITE